MIVGKYNIVSLSDFVYFVYTRSRWGKLHLYQIIETSLLLVLLFQADLMSSHFLSLLGMNS